ncbi:MAG: hypothetical protein M1835_005776 [Candelina submexicana]|nr:MAG: hypothetical protein M1835_005776 [Candelina submexicana]
MDFWSRLIGGAGVSPFNKQATTNNPQQRLIRFKRIYNQLLQTWRSTPSLTAESAAAAVDSIRLFLQHLTTLLHEESHSPSPHLCLSFASSTQIYSTISKIASLSRNEGLTREAIAAFSTLVDSEDQEFLGENAFAKAIMSFAGKLAGTSAMIIGPETEGDVVELLFGIAAKIRLQPELLPAWFTFNPRESEAVNGAAQENKFVGAAQKDDFPLFYLLIDYVHHEGKVGDFARTGLLYIIESAASSEDLERWIVESDLATLMASGLGALYSQLSRKLVVSFAATETPAILALSDYSLPPAPSEGESSASEDFQGHMDTFLSYLLFWQDVLEHCKSAEVKQTLLDHFQILFLQQLLYVVSLAMLVSSALINDCRYPSLLESSDIDGGSSVAVFTYLRHILESLENPELIHQILHYLLALPDQAAPQTASAKRPVLGISRRKTLDLLTNFPDMANKPSPSLFSLVDLIISSMRSKSQQTVTATLKLVSVILRRHHGYAVATLLQTLNAVSSDPQRTIGAHNKEMEVLFSLVSTIGGETDIDRSYESHLKDNLNLIETHPCSAQMILMDEGNRLFSQGNSTSSDSTAEPKEVSLLTLKPGDPFLQTLLQAMQRFFVNTVEMNLSLTETIVDLAACGHMRLEGWLVVDPARYVYHNDEYADGQDHEQELDDEIAAITNKSVDSTEARERGQINALKQARREPSWAHEHTPPILAVLQSLTDQICTYRFEFPDLDIYLSERRQIFQVSDGLTEALASAPPSVNRSIQQPKKPPASIVAATSTPLRIPTLSSVSQHMFSPSVSRSSSPLRGRQQRVSALDGRIPTPSSTQRPGQHSLTGSPVSSQRSRIAGSLSPSRRLESAPPKNNSADPKVLMQKVKVRSAPVHERGVTSEIFHNGPTEGTASAVNDETSIESRSTEGQSDGISAEEKAEVSVSHLLTNIIILQEFIMELAALIQVRASLFGEIKFL